MDKKVSFLNQFSAIRHFLKGDMFSRRQREGQHFLLHTPTLERIVDSAEIGENDFVLEIGSGPSNLTLFLIERAKFVLAVEKDCRFKDLHKSLFKENPPIRFIYEDILKMDIDKLNEFIPAGYPLLNSNWKVVGNIPYNITTPLITMLVSPPFNFATLTFLVQKEVAERIVSKPNSKKYGIMSIRVQYFYQPEVKFSIKPEMFSPPPQITSSLLHLRQKLKLPFDNTEDQRKFFHLIEAVFRKRRKTLLNGIMESGLIFKSREEVAKSIESIKINPTKRPEALSLDDFVKIFSSLFLND